MASPHICILGGGFGGLYTALKLSRYRWPGRSRPRIVLIDQTDRFLFTPLLYDLLTEDLQTWEIAPLYRTLLSPHSVEFQQDRVEAIDLPHRTVTLQSGQSLTYDRLVLALGQQVRQADLPHSSTLYSFRTLADVERIQQRLASLASRAHPIQVVIVGAGPSGVELACNLADQLPPSSQIQILDRRHQILRGYPVAVQRAASQALAQRHVQVQLGVQLEAIGPDSITFSQAEQPVSDPADLILWTIGSQPWPWLKNLDCRQTHRGILTSSTLQLMDYPEVFALGDMATLSASSAEFPATAQVALQQAQIVAHNLHNSLKGRSLKPFRYRHQGEILSLGSDDAVLSVSCGGARLTLRGRFAFWLRRWIYWLRLPTPSHRIQVGLHWLRKIRPQQEKGKTQSSVFRIMD